MYRCVGASTLGRLVPSTMLPSRSTMTWFSGVRSSNFTPEGLITISPVFGSRMLTLPLVQVTRFAFGSSQFSRQTSLRRSGSWSRLPLFFALATAGTLDGVRLDPLEPLHDVVLAPAEVVVKGEVLGVEFPVRRPFLVAGL